MSTTTTAPTVTPFLVLVAPFREWRCHKGISRGSGSHLAKRALWHSAAGSV